jgi:PAS domain S-box-containing protein
MNVLRTLNLRWERAPAQPLSADSPPGPTFGQSVALSAAVAIAYVASAAVGFRLAFVAEQVTTVWAPTGIAIAALLIGGFRLAPAIWIGALMANWGTAAPPWTSFVIATGNTLEAVAAVWWLRRARQFDFTFRRIADVLAFLLIAVITCTAISATLGVLALSIAGAQPWDRFPILWFDWWLGDAMGALIVAPAILSASSHPWSRSDAIRTVIWVGASSLITHLVFGQDLSMSPHPLEYVIFPVMIAAAVTGGPRLTTSVVLSASAVAIWHTVNGEGPFATTEAHHSLILLQAFMGVLAGTSLLLAAAVAERLGSEQRERHHATEVDRILESIGEGFVAFDRHFRYVYVNAPAARMLGRRREELLGRTPWEIFPEDTIRESRRMLESALHSAVPSQYEIHVPGWNRWFDNRVSRTADGLTVFFADITARKAAESALRQSRDVLTLAMRGGSMGAWSRDLATDEVWWSRELEELFGLQPGAFNRTEAGFFEFVHEEDREAVQRAVSHAIQHGSDYIIEFRFRHADDEWRWMEGRGRAVYDDDGTPRHLYGIGIDVTERKRAELALREAKLSAEAANHLKDQFLATLSHELRTPLNAILGYAQMLQTNTIAPDKRQRAIEVIERNAVAQTQLVNDLLDMSRITTGKVRLDPAPVPVVTVLREALDGVKPAAEAKGIALEIDVDPFAGSVKADSTRLQQVFWNLLTNAVKFTAEGGRIAVSLRRGKARVEIDVKDNGRGISPDFLPFVFDPFRQAESGFDRAHGGLGLGLAITRQLVELHGGTIVAASPGLGQGTTFTVVLPSVDLDGPSLAS